MIIRFYKTNRDVNYSTGMGVWLPFLRHIDMEGFNKFIIRGYGFMLGGYQYSFEDFCWQFYEIQTKRTGLTFKEVWIKIITELNWRKREMTKIDLLEHRIKNESLNYMKSPRCANKNVVTHLHTDVGLDMMSCYDVKADKHQFFILNEIPIIKNYELKDMEKEISYYDSQNKLQKIKNYNGQFNYVDEIIFNTAQPFYPIEHKYADIDNLIFEDIISLENADLIAWFLSRVNLESLLKNNGLEILDTAEIKGNKYNLYKFIENEFDDYFQSINTEETRGMNVRVKNALCRLSFIEYWDSSSDRHYIQPSKYKTIREHLLFMNGGIDFVSAGLAFQR